MLRRLEAMLAVADREASLIITGNGDVLEPEFGMVAIGSGGATRRRRRALLGAHRDGAVGDRQAKRCRSPAICASTPTSTTIEALE